MKYINKILNKKQERQKCRKNMKTKMLLISMIMVCWSVIGVSAQTFIDNNIKYSIGLNNTVSVVSNSTKYTGSITIPSSVVSNGITYTVTDVGYSAFLNCTGLTDISFPPTLKAIAQQAFSGCTGLTNVTLPASLTTLGASAFAYCSKLVSINIPRIKVIDNSTFTDCIKMTSLVLPSSVKSIGQNAFYNCTSLSVNIPDSVESIGATAYYKTLLNTVVLPLTLNKLAVSAFDGTPWYTAQPNGMIYVGEWVYRYKGTLPTSIEINEGVKHITQNIFSYSMGLVSVKLPASLTEIPNSAFMGCIGLTTINLPANIKYIDDIAFYACTKLAVLSFPENMERVGDRALDNTAWYNAQPDGNVYAGNWYYKYKGTMPPNTEITIANETVGLADLLFLNVTNLKTVKIPASVKYIGSSAFQGCTALTSIYAFPATPVDLTTKTYVFLNVNVTSCALYVPTASVNLYQTANQWKDFTNIVGINTGVYGLATDDFNLRTRHLTIIVENISEHNIDIYNAAGKLIYSGKGLTEIGVGAPGVYMVRVGNLSKKIIVD